MAAASDPNKLTIKAAIRIRQPQAAVVEAAKAAARRKSFCHPSLPLSFPDAIAFTYADAPHRPSLPPSLLRSSKIAAPPPKPVWPARPLSPPPLSDASDPIPPSAVKPRRRKATLNTIKKNVRGWSAYLRVVCVLSGRKEKGREGRAIPCHKTQFNFIVPAFAFLSARRSDRVRPPQSRSRLLSTAPRPWRTSTFTYF